MKKQIAIFLATTMAVLLLASCGKSSGVPEMLDSREYAGGSSASLYDPAEAVSAPDLYFTSSNSLRFDSEILHEQEEAYDSSPTMTSEGLAEKIIYSANADIETVDFDGTIDMVYELLGFNGAFIESSNIGGRNYAQSYYSSQTYRTASFTLRVPTDRFEAVTDGLDALGNVISLRTDAQNITAQFFDTESRLASYRIQEERLLAMLEKADTVADMITIESSLADVRYNIESLTSTLKNWQSMVDYSTLTLFIREVEELTEIVPIRQSYWQQIGEGIRATMRSIGDFFKNLFRWVVVNLPVLIILAVVAIACVIAVRRKIRKRRKAKKDDAE